MENRRLLFLLITFVKVKLLMRKGKENDAQNKVKLRLYTKQTNEQTNKMGFISCPKFYWELGKIECSLLRLLL